MEIKRTASAGTMESSDIMITVKPSNNGIKIELKSDVEKQFGNQVKKIIKNTIEGMGVKNVYIRAQDRGALDYAIKARTRTALERASKGAEEIEK
ncbi:citrate lyase acyl carrier protein [Halothermothrix orenii]|uniref:Citrate lyase acyl carrier protein n=1 Tax=Halothermothrix orenii (strain H 168 / OCM 544 / DSM 9562) TaxID=373903 RepID=CITD_HALOH|nr:citrate lyase acyl carrier protein [Halothermothrix orenii]B8D1Z8.1 RecName: Full=Citrate lyase acyl carrier protein; AltName: Full=Citrate lyase gamma chain [Halothermothrix orenii H 168]ACL69225.1 Citrate (pro-3S)-lyase, beta subunit [Halothermothrix orenii H 168]